MLHYTFVLNLTAEQILPYYRGQAKRLSVMSEQGLRLELPAERLRPFVTSYGIRRITSYNVCYTKLLR